MECGKTMAYNNNRKNDRRNNYDTRNNNESNYENKRYNNTERPKNITVDIPLCVYGQTRNNRTYEPVSLLDLMNSLQNTSTFEKISIPVYIDIPVPNKPNAKSSRIAGYMKSYDIENCKIKCVIMNRFINAYQSIEAPLVIPRVIIRDNKCSFIIALDICNESEIAVTL